MGKYPETIPISPSTDIYYTYHAAHQESTEEQIQDTSTTCCPKPNHSKKTGLRALFKSEPVNN